MGDKKRPATPVTNENVYGERLSALCDARWQGNMSAMARDVGCSPSALSKALRGVQPPGQHLLSVIAQHPGVNSSWVFHGIGEPVSAIVAGAGEYALPVAVTPLPGRPAEYPTDLTPQKVPVAQSLFRETRYWLELHEGSSLTNDEELALKAGDLLLIETEGNWRADPEVAAERVCILRTPDGLTLRRVFLAAATDKRGVRLVAECSAENETYPYRRRLRNIKIRGSRRTPAATDIQTLNEAGDIVLEDIVGICLFVLRRC